MNLPIKNKQGFTLIELVVVTLMIGILASIALMQFLSFRERGYNAILQSDLRAAYTAAMQFHLASSSAVQVTETDLEDYGYRPSDDVTLTVDNGWEATLEITASHPGTPNIYQVDHAGRVSRQ